MDWKSDWLYQLVFDEVARYWIVVQKEGQGRFGPAPEVFYVQDHTAYTTSPMLMCVGTIQGLWAYDGTAFEAIPTGKTIIFNQTIQGMFYTHGAVRFHITPNRKYVLWNIFVGPRYGRGTAYRVQGQGKRGILLPEHSFGTWVS